MKQAIPLCLLVTNNFPPAIGGAGNVYAALAAAAGGRIAVLAAATDYRSGEPIPGLAAHDAKHAANPAYPLERIAAIRGRLWPHPPLWRRAFAALVEEPAIRWALWRRVRTLARRSGAQVLCIADDETVGWLIRPAQAAGLGVVLYGHGDDLKQRPGAAAARRDARRRGYFARADAIIAVSAAAAADLAARYAIPRERIDVVPNGIDRSLFKPGIPESGLRERHGLAGRRVIVTVARLVARKGVDRVIRALPRLAAAVPELRYLVVGDGAERSALETLARELGVADRVVFAGAVPLAEVPAYLALGEVFALPNRRLPDGEDEGFGLVFLEANAMGLPVLGGRAGGVPEVVREGETGLLVDGTDADAVAAALLRLLTDAPLRARLSAGGLALAAGAGWEGRAAAFLAVCERVATARARPGGPAGTGRPG